jgi:hypothetical protein
MEFVFFCVVAKQCAGNLVADVELFIKMILLLKELCGTSPHACKQITDNFEVEKS